MAGFDRTGPIGLGSMIGRKFGYCAGHMPFGYINPRLWGAKTYGSAFCVPRGATGRRGYRHWYYATGLPGWARAGLKYPYWGCFYYPFCFQSPHEITPEEEANILKEQVKRLQEEINAINEQINILEKASAEEKK